MNDFEDLEEYGEFEDAEDFEYLGELEDFEDLEAMDGELEDFEGLEAMAGDFEDFEELEFKSDFNGEPLLMCIAILKGKIKRIMFIQFDSENHDIPKPLTELQLKNFLDLKGQRLISFFDQITR